MPSYAPALSETLPKGEQDEATAAAEQVTKSIQSYFDEDTPIEYHGLVRNIKKLKAGIDEKPRKELVRALGKLLLNGEETKFEKPPLTGLDPYQILEIVIIDAFSRIKDKGSLPYLESCYSEQGDKIYRDLSSLIESMGGTVPPIKKPAPKTVKPGITEEEKKARRQEVEQLLEKARTENITDIELDTIVKRIGEIGGPQDAMPIIELLKSEGVRMITMQNGLRALDKLGSHEAQPFLLEQLRKPMPKDADLTDDADMDCIVRAKAVLALGQCGDESALKTLTEMARDKNQYERVRNACRKAAGEIRERLEETDTGESR